MPPRLDRFRIALVRRVATAFAASAHLRRQFPTAVTPSRMANFCLNQRGRPTTASTIRVQAILTRIRPSLWLYQLALQVPDELAMRPPNCSAIPSGASLDI